MRTPILPGGKVYLNNNEEEHRQDAVAKTSANEDLTAEVALLEEEVSTLQGKITTYTTAIQILETALADNLPEGYVSPLPTT